MPTHAFILEKKGKGSVTKQYQSVSNQACMLKL